MAGAVSSAENGGSLSGSRSIQPPPQQQQQQQQQQQYRRRPIHGAPGLRQAPAGRPLRPRLSSSSRASSSSSSAAARASSRASPPFGGGSGSGSGGGFLPSNAARIGGRGSHSSISTRTNSSSSSSSGLWASIMSLGASAFPASLSSGTAAVVGVPPASTPTPRRVTRRNAASSSSAIVARAAAAAAVGTRPRNGSSLSAPSSSALLPVAVSGVGDRSRLAVASRAGEGVRVLPPPPPPAVVAPSVEVAAGDRQEGAGAAAAAAAVVPVSGSVAGKAGSAKKLVYLEGGHSVYTCSMCRAHLATRDHVVSECFHGHGGRAFLFERCVNVSTGRPEDRLLLTGMHVVADISCKACGADLGWKYEEAADKSQKYKEGKFILERCAVTLEGRSGDGYYGSSSSGRFGGAEQRCGSSSIIGWGADNAPFAGGGSRW